MALVYAPFIDRHDKGLLYADPLTGTVYYRRLPDRPWRPYSPSFRLSGHQPPDGTHGYWFVELRYTVPRSRRRYRRRKIGIHRLVWLLHHSCPTDCRGRCRNRRSIPTGYEIDHRNTDTSNNSLANLRLRRMGENRYNATSFGYSASDAEF